jgi:predicted nucleotidyltransferase
MNRFVPRSPLGELVSANRDLLLAAAARRNAHDVRLFGSLARGEDAVDSDVDLLVEFDDAARPLDVVSLTCDAEEILGVRVDVGTVASLRPDVRADALNDAVLL